MIKTYSGDDLGTKVIRGVLRSRCECGRFVQAFRIVDVSGLPDEVTRGQKCACDVCWTGWMRHDPRHQRHYQGRPFRVLDWLTLHGMPAENITRQRQSNALLRAKLEAQRGEIAARPADDKRQSELARLDDIIERRVGPT